ncbi:MAG TPA: PLP-dependent aspartate aminotransferase family protein [Rhodocyclaceae bacterium]|nr:PLP-dependent aspartate aminotransferase family protein [Rhodocyclaceae bacterium]
MTTTRKLSPRTLTAQALGRIALPYHDIAPPIHVSTTFERGGDGSYPGGRLYARDVSPAFDQAEALLCELEGGHQSLLFASGMAAATAVIMTLAPGQRLLACRTMYWALRNWLVGFCAQWQISLDFYDGADIDDLMGRLHAGPTDLLWIETPANPSWEVTDIAAATAAAHALGATVVVDSTVATPVHTRPLGLGADIVMHSATKYLNGHSDVIAGALVCREDSPRWQQIRRNRNMGGAILGTFESWLLLRGMRTLHLRVAQSSASAQAIAEALAGHPALVEVLYPGLPSHANHDVAARQMQGGFGGMLSIRTRGGEARARAVTAKLEVFKRATSLGAVESLAEHRASVEGPGSACPVDLIRLSIGIESTDDLLADLLAALDSGREGG